MRRRSSWTGSGLDSFNHILGAMATISVHVRQRSPQHQWMNVGSGRIDLSRDPDLSDFKLLVTSDLSAAPIVQLPLNRSTSIKRDNDSTIIVATAGSSVEHSIKFCDASSCSVVWIALSVLVNGDVVSMVATPTVENIDFMRKYLVSVHPIMRDLVAASVCRTGFTQSLFESFAFAEMSQRFDVLHHFREIVVSLLNLNSHPLLSILLSAENIEHTIACMEYDSTMGVIDSYQTTHRCFLGQSKLHCVLPSLHDRIKTLARTNYHIVYLKNAVASFRLSASVVSTIDSIVAANSCSIVEVLLSDRSFVKKLTGAVVPMMVSLNGSLIQSAAAHEPALRFLKELLALPIPETAMRRLVRKLCGGRLMDLLDHAFASSTESSTQCGVLDVLSALQSVSSDRFYEHVFSADGQLVSSMINRLTDSSEPSVASDRSIEFLQSLIPTFDPFAVNSELVAAVDDMVGSMLPLLIGSLQRGGSAIGKLNKVSDFVGWLIQTRPDLCRSRFGGCLTWFVSLADRVLTDLDLSAQQKHLRMSSARLLSQAASVSDDTYVRAMLNRTGMLESVLLMLLSNSGSEGMFGSVVQGMICTMAEHWLNSFLSGRASSLVERVGPKAVSDSLRQLMFSISSAISRVCDVSDARTVKPSTKPRAMSLQRLNSLELIEIKHAGDREQLVDMGRILPAQVPSVSDGLQVAADAEIRRLRDRCQELDQHNSQLSAERDKICSDNDSMSQEVRVLRRQFATQRLASLTAFVVRRKQSIAFGRLKLAALNRVAVAPSEPATEQKSDPFLMDALYVLAWQRKLDRSRAMALTLRLSLLPMIKKNYLRSAVQTWRERVRQLKTPVIVVQPMAFSPIAVKPQEYRQPAVSKGPMWNVCYTPASARSFQTAVSVSSFGSSSSPLEDSPHSSDFTVSSLGSTPSMSTGSPFAFHALPTLNRSSTRDLGEAIGTHGLKRSDSDMYYMIHAMKGNDSPVPTHCHVPSPKPKPLGRLRY